MQFQKYKEEEFTVIDPAKIVNIEEQVFNVTYLKLDESFKQIWSKKKMSLVFGSTMCINQHLLSKYSHFTRTLLPILCNYITSSSFYLFVSTCALDYFVSLVQDRIQEVTLGVENQRDVFMRYDSIPVQSCYYYKIHICVKPLHIVQFYTKIIDWFCNASQCVNNSKFVLPNPSNNVLFHNRRDVEYYNRADPAFVLYPIGVTKQDQKQNTVKVIESLLDFFPSNERSLFEIGFVLSSNFRYLPSCTFIQYEVGPF